MANKNYAGTQLIRAQQKEDRLIDKIDKRESNGNNLSNIDNTFRNYTHSDGGERVWSF